MKLKRVDILKVNLELLDSKMLVGLLALKDRRIYFEYDKEFLSSGLEISPFKLPLKANLQMADLSLFEGLHGVFNDSLPDGWGRLLLDRQLRSLNIEPGALTPLDRLAYVGQRGMGALSYEPYYSDFSDTDASLDLDYLAENSLQVLEGRSEGILDDLFLLNGSSAGARPKIMVGVNEDRKSLINGVLDLPEGYQHWIIKFNSSSDLKDACAIEYAYSLMAREAGIEMMDTCLFSGASGRTYFGVKRFDREHNSRVHMHTVCGLLNADFRVPALDYRDILSLTFSLTKDYREVEKIFRLAVFNVLAHNRDDHSKNFSFLMNHLGDWRLSPAYDITFSNGPGGEQSSMVMGEGRDPGIQQLTELASTMSMKLSLAQDIITRVKETIQKWPSFAKEANVSKTSTTLIEKQISRIK